jgi:hypothetical protein
MRSSVGWTGFFREKDPIRGFEWMLAADQLPTARVVAFPALLLAFHATLAAFVVRALSARHTQASGFQSRIPFAFASGVAFADVRGGHFRVLQVSCAVGFEVPLAQELTIVEFHRLHPTEAVPEAHKATATRWGNAAIQQGVGPNRR